MSDLIIGYYLISGVLFLFFVGSGSIIYDMAWNKEKQIFIRKPKTETKQQLTFDTYDDDDDDDLPDA